MKWLYPESAREESLSFPFASRGQNTKNKAFLLPVSPRASADKSRNKPWLGQWLRGDGSSSSLEGKLHLLRPCSWAPPGHWPPQEPHLSWWLRGLSSSAPTPCCPALNNQPGSCFLPDRCQWWEAGKETTAQSWLTRAAEQGASVACLMKRPLDFYRIYLVLECHV